jgi:hydroxyethylthiazole kinase-like uncharacterized protein yjeF
MDMQEFQPLRRLFARPPAANKYDYGHVLVVGGAPGMVGAPFLSARAALRIGAGLATIASSANVIDKLERQVEEIMTLRLPAGNRQAVQALQAFIGKRKVKALAIGPGLAASRTGLVKHLLATLAVPVVLDAGGLRAYDNDLADLRAAGRHNLRIVLLPHTGEFRRLIGRELPGSRTALKQLLADTAKATGTTIILKGDRSLVVGDKGRLYVNSSGNAGLATAGTGDVLTGMVAGLLAQAFDPYEAASCAVYLHGLAGDLAAADTTEPGLIASDLIDYLPAALQKVRAALGKDAAPTRRP